MNFLFSYYLSVMSVFLDKMKGLFSGETSKMIKQNVPINDHLLKTLKNNPSSILLDFMSKKTFPPQIGIDFWIDAISKSQNIDYVDSYGETLLMLFMRFGSPSDVQFLLGLGADPLFSSYNEDEEETKHPLLDAVLTKNDENILVFLDYCQQHGKKLSFEILYLCKSRVVNRNTRILDRFDLYQQWKFKNSK